MDKKIKNYNIIKAKIIFAIILAILCAFKSFGQNKNSFIKKLDFVELSFFSHSISYPLKASNHIIGINRAPGVSLGVAKSVWKEKKRLKTKYYLSLSFYHQKELHYGIELSNSILVQYTIFSKVNLEGALGLGYLHTFEDAPIYEQKNGIYSQISDWGRSQFTVSSFIGTSVQISQKIALITNYKFLLQLPFARKAEITFIPHSRVSLGLRMNINTK